MRGRPRSRGQGCWETRLPGPDLDASVRVSRRPRCRRLSGPVGPEHRDWENLPASRCRCASGTGAHKLCVCVCVCEAPEEACECVCVQVLGGGPRWVCSGAAGLAVQGESCAEGREGARQAGRQVGRQARLRGWSSRWRARVAEEETAAAWAGCSSKARAAPEPSARRGGARLLSQRLGG